MPIIYQHRRNDTNEIFYIGIGTTEKRASSIQGRNKYWKHIVNKVGFTFEIVNNDRTWLECQYTEKYLISYYGRKDLGNGSLVNMTDGGEGQLNPSTETRAVMSEKRKLRITKQSTRDKIGRFMTGNTYASGGLGIKKSQETKRKMSESQKGNKNCLGFKRPPITDEHRAKLSIAAKNRTKK